MKEDTYNALLKRKEVNLEIEHDGGGTPSRVDIRKAIAAKFSTKNENVYVLDVETKTGTQTALCRVQVYDDPVNAKGLVANYVQVRNLPPDERKRVREEEAKKAEAKPKPEKPKPGPAKAEKVEKPKEETKQPEKPKQETHPAEQPKKKEVPPK